MEIKKELNIEQMESVSGGVAPATKISAETKIASATKSTLTPTEASTTLTPESSLRTSADKSLKQPVKSIL